VALHADPQDREQLFLMELASGAVRPLAPSDSTDNAPAFSPDGRQVAFVSTRDGPRDLYRVDVASGAVVRLTTGLDVWAQPSWAPDGRRILVSASSSGVNEVYVVNADGTGLVRLNADSEVTVDWGRQGAVPPPVAGVSVNLAPVSGVVLVRLRGTNRFVNLARLRNVPVGSELDVRRGRVRLVSSAGARRTQSGIFYQGRAVVRQPRGRAPVTTLQVSGPLACPRRSAAGADAAKPPRVRRLWGNAKGKFRTQGRYGSAAVRGTLWLTEDRCDGTFFRVRVGRIEVFDQVRNRRVIVRAGQTYFARARR
jgi:hypothetical protein